MGSPLRVQFHVSSSYHERQPNQRKTTKRGFISASKEPKNALRELFQGTYRGRARGQTGVVSHTIHNPQSTNHCHPPWRRQRMFSKNAPLLTGNREQGTGDRGVVPQPQPQPPTIPTPPTLPSTLPFFIPCCTATPLHRCTMASTVSTVPTAAEALQTAADEGDDKTMALLLADPDADPAAYCNQAVRVAAERGHDAVVVLLLADPRVDPSVWNCVTLCRAVASGHDAVVVLLLADPRIHPACAANTPMRWAASNGHDKVVALLLADPRVDPADCSNEAVREAVWCGHDKVVALLLADPRVDPSADSNEAVQLAAEMGHANILARLLADPRVDPADGGNAAVRSAARCGYDTAVALLLTDSRVRKALLTMAPLRPRCLPSPARTRLKTAIADEARWRRRRALALVREQRRAARDHALHGPWRGPPQATAPAAGRQRVR